MKDATMMLNLEVSEAEAIDKAKNGDAGGYEALYHLHKRQIYLLCLRSAGDVCDAEDLTQEVFLQVYRKISSFRGEAKFGSWLYRVALNFALMHARRRRPEHVSLTALRENLADSPPVNPRIRDWRGSLPVERIALGRAINNLPKKKRNVVLLHDVKGYTHREVAARLGVTAGTSKSQLYKAHLALRDMLRPSA